MSLFVFGESVNDGKRAPAIVCLNVCSMECCYFLSAFLMCPRRRLLIIIFIFIVIAIFHFLFIYFVASV